MVDKITFNVRKYCQSLFLREIVENCSRKCARVVKKLRTILILDNTTKKHLDSYIDIQTLVNQNIYIIELIEKS